MRDRVAFDSIDGWVERSPQGFRENMYNILQMLQTRGCRMQAWTECQRLGQHYGMVGSVRVVVSFVIATATAFTELQRVYRHASLPWTL